MGEHVKTTGELAPEGHRSALRLEESGHGPNPAVPIGGLGVELPSPGSGQRLETSAPRILCLTPFGIEPPRALQALEPPQHGPVIDLEFTARHLLDPPGDAEAMHRLETQRLEDEQIHRALNDIGRRLVHPGLRKKSRDDDTVTHLDCQDVIIKMTEWGNVRQRGAKRPNWSAAPHYNQYAY